jgi:CubicO group peptidase (beta-lactamase class C family)
MSSQHGLSERLQGELATWFEGRQGDHAFPSVVFGVFDRDGLLFSHGQGRFDESGRTPTAHTVYRICSMTKSFCMAALLRLQEQGRLALADPVNLYVPEMPSFVDGDRVVAPTVEMLMSNSSGLPEDNRWADHQLDMTREDLLDVLRSGLRYSFPPGEEYQYSNIGFAVLGLVVERVAGQEFEPFVQRELLDPLGLAATGFDPAALGAADHGAAVGLTSFDDGASWVDRPLKPLGAFSAAGSLFSTVSDIARWSAWLSSAFDRDLGADDVLSAAARRRMQRIHTPKAPDDPDVPRTTNVGYGLGLTIEHDVRFGAIAQHSGGMPGFTSNMRWHCSSGLGVVVMANTDGMPADRWTSDILRLVLDELQPPARVIRTWPETFEAAATIDAALLAGRLPDIDGTYAANVLSDVPLDVRERRRADAVSAVGGITSPQPSLESRLDGARSPADLAWHVDGGDGRLTCRIELTATLPPLVQRLEITVEPPGGDPQAGSARFNRTVR